MGKKRKRTNKRGGMSNLQISLDNVEAAFREGKKMGLTVVKETFREESYSSYEKTVKTMIRDLSKLPGVDEKRVLPKYMNGETWDRYFDHLEERYANGTLAASTISKRVHALEAFRQMVNGTNVCGKDSKIRVGDKYERLEGLKDRGVLRSKDNITAMKPSHDQVSLVHSNINTRTKNGQMALIVNQFQYGTGGRIKSVFKLEVRDIDFEKGRITFRNDKNNHTRVVPMTSGARDILKSAIAGKSAGSKVFGMKREDGREMAIGLKVKTIQTYTNAAAKRAGIYRDDRRYTTHSNRKGYAQNLYDSTRNMTKKELDKLIGDYTKSQGSNREQVVQRMKNELDRINTYRIKNGMDKKPFSQEQLRRMLVSLHLGHSRLDVVLSYISPDPLTRSRA